MEFTINGATHELTRDGIETALASQQPAGISMYSVDIAGRRFPVKQVLAIATGLSNHEFPSSRAQRVLRDLGFEVLSTAPQARIRIPESTRTFAGVDWGLAASDAGYEEAPSGKLHLPGCAHGVVSPVRTWPLDEVLNAWTLAANDELRSVTGPGWCSDCVAIRGVTDPGAPVLPGDPSIKTGRAERGAIAEAARVVLGPGLRGEASVFAGAVVTWTAETAAGLRAALETSTGDGSFLEKLGRQLQGQPRAVVLLAAELCFVQRLPLLNVRSDTKQAMVRTILNVLPEPPELPEEIIDALGTRGVFNGGQGFNQQLAQHVMWLCRFIEVWAALDSTERENALEDPWIFRDRTLEAQPEAAPMRNSLLALVWPTYFERIVSVSDKRSIRDAFAAVLPSANDDVDRDLLALRDRMDPTGALDIDWYTSPWEEEWRLKAPPAEQRGWAAPAANPGSPLNLPALSFDVQRGWDRDEIRSAALRSWTGDAPIEELLEQVDTATSYLVTMQADDQVFTRGADGEAVAVGIVGDLDATLARPVKWRSPLAAAELPRAVLDLLESSSTFTDTGYLVPGSELIDDSVPNPATPVRLPRSTPELADRLHYDRPWLDNVIDLLEERRQLIFFGPPGTGKTFLAQALAEFIAPQDARRIVQFHPSYSYEDFFEGFRPTVNENGTATFRLAPGPVRLLAKAASANPSVPHVLIIDEINRANIAKVFGELYLLLEYRDAQVSLQYSPEESFHLPKNLFIIGTMNTADRSISLVDAAIRRRFSFVELHPADEPVRGLLDRWSTAENHDVSRGALLRRLNERIGDIDRDFQIGPSYVMGASARTAAGLARVWEYDILPLLDEHYYGRMTRSEVRATFGLAALEPSVIDEPAEAFDAPAEE